MDCKKGWSFGELFKTTILSSFYSPSEYLQSKRIPADFLRFLHEKIQLIHFCLCDAGMQGRGTE